MHRDLLSHLPVVLAVARCGGFAAAAAQLNMSPSAVSHAIKTVEDSLGMPLFVRTTRSVALTEAGAGFMASVGPALTTIEEAGERLRSAKGQVTGVLRLNVPRVALPIAVTPIVAEMAWRYPDLTIEITSDDGLADKDHYFEDFAVGQVFRSKFVPVDKARIVAFAQEFDPQPQHLSEEAASATHFGQLVASGWHTAAISMRQFVQNLPPVPGGTQGVGVESITWPRPVRPGDELPVETEVTAMRPSRSRPDKGLVTIRDQTFNQDGELVQTICHTFMAPRRAAEMAATQAKESVLGQK